jgi:hypothetical protein
VIEPPSKKLLDPVHDAIRLNPYSYRTAEQLKLAVASNPEINTSKSQLSAAFELLG